MMNDGQRKRFGVIAFVLLAAMSLIISSSQPAAFAQRPPNNQALLDDETANSLRETQQSAILYMTEEVRQVGTTEYTSRWSPVIVTQPGTLTAIFADCLQNEFAVSAQHMFENRNIENIHSFAVGLPDNYMTWLTIVFNWGDEELNASTGVICADETGSPDSLRLDYSTQIIIQNTINNIIRQQGSINIQYISLVYQKITQNALQIINVTGNNNTVNAIINQTASQLALQNGTSPEQIDAIVNATAVQQGVLLPAATAGANATGAAEAAPTGGTAPNANNTGQTGPVGPQAAAEAETPPTANSTDTDLPANGSPTPPAQSPTLAEQGVPSVSVPDNQPPTIPPPAEEEETTPPVEEEETPAPEEEEEENPTPTLETTTVDDEGEDDDDDDGGDGGEGAEEA